jgi:lysophospholipase L1-like esterase
VISPPQYLGPLRPLRVHVLGNSTAVLVQPEHGPRDGGTYGEQLAVLLSDAGVPTVVSHAGTWFGRANDSLAAYERDVRDHFPDVLVINFGIIDCQSNALPTPVARHVMTWHRTSRRGAATYRNRVVPPVWRVLRSYQRWMSARDGGRTYRLPPKRFVTDLRRTIDQARKDTGALVLLLDIDPPGDRVEHWLPGTRRRAARYNLLLAEVAAAYDDHVRLVAASTTITEPAAQLPDGLHRTTEGHALTAQLLAEQIQAWLGR